MDLTKEALEHLAEAGGKAAVIGQKNLSDAISIVGDGLMIEPENVTLQDLERYLPCRRRPRGVYHTDDFDSFVGLVDRYEQESGDAPVLIRTDTLEMHAVAILNAHVLDEPLTQGHHDYGVDLKMEATPEYAALIRFVDQPQTQRSFAEFLEDYHPEITCRDADDILLPISEAISAVRKVTIDHLRKRETVEGSFKTQKTGIELVEAKSDLSLPSWVVFECKPFPVTPSLQFYVRVGLRTGAEDPMFTFRIRRHEGAKLEIANSFVSSVKVALPNNAVRIGRFSDRAGG